jgi:predicted RNase H-like HicB family nuclease
MIAGAESYKYEIIISWNNEDRIFVADVPELPGCIAHGASQEAALREAKKAMNLSIEMANAKGKPVPEPKGADCFWPEY